MFRTIRSILLLLILCFIATGVPLYADTIDLNFPVISSSGGTLQLQGNLEQINSHQWRMTATLSADKAISTSFQPSNSFSLMLYFNEELIRTIDIKDQLAQLLDSEVSEISDKNPISFEITLDQRELDLPDGEYEVRLAANIQNLGSNQHYSDKLRFQTVGEYKPALQAITRNQTALTLYFPNEEFSHLIPITRVIPYTVRPLRSTLDQLELGPISTLGLPEGPSIPTGAKLALNQRIAGIYLPQDIGKYDSNSSDAAIALGSFVQSITSIAEVDAVQFYFNNRIVETGFHGAVMNKPHYPVQGAMVYGITYSNTNRILLMPVPYPSQNTTFDALFNAMKYNGNHNEYSFTRHPAVPEEVSLLNYQLQNDILTLNFSEELTKALETNPDRQAAMIEAIIYSFTSLEAVDRVVLQVDGRELNEIAGLAFNYPYKPTKFINPEK